MLRQTAGQAVYGTAEHTRRVRSPTRSPSLYISMPFYKQPAQLSHRPRDVRVRVVARSTGWTKNAKPCSLSTNFAIDRGLFCQIK